MGTIDAQVSEYLRSIEKENRYRRLFDIQAREGKYVTVQGKMLLNLSGNSYLGLESHIALEKTICSTMGEWGVGGTASRYISGNTMLYTELEGELAEWKGFEGSLVFSSGYMTNCGVLEALGRLGVIFYLDRLCHASIVAGVRLSGCRFRRFRHNDIQDLVRKLERDSGRGVEQWVIVEGVYSMDGDLAPIREIVKLRSRFQKLRIYIDDAHGTGVLGRSGGGILEKERISPAEIDILMGTFSKGLGLLGGYVCCRSTLRDFLLQETRTLIYSTALPPGLVAAAADAIRLARLMTDERDRLDRLRTYLIDGLRQSGFTVPDCSAGVVPVIFGDAGEVMKVQRRLVDRGFFVGAVRRPTVPPGSERLRITLNPALTEEDIEEFIGALQGRDRPGGSVEKEGDESVLSRDGVIVLGTDTDVGKTWFCAELAKKLKERGRRPVYLKPFSSGGERDELGTVRSPDLEAVVIAAALEEGESAFAPVRYELPAAPHAAIDCGEPVWKKEVIEGTLEQAFTKGDFIIIEGIGGAMVPLGNGRMADEFLLGLAPFPVVLVVDIKLGAINHTLLTLARLRMVDERRTIYLYFNRREPDKVLTEETIRKSVHGYPSVSIEDIVEDWQGTKCPGS